MAYIYIYIYIWFVARRPRPPHPRRDGIPPRGGAAVGRPGGWGGRSGWAAGPGGHDRPLGPVGGPAGGLSGGGADEWMDGRSRAGGWWADG